MQIRPMVVQERQEARVRAMAVPPETGPAARREEPRPRRFTPSAETAPAPVIRELAQVRWEAITPAGWYSRVGHPLLNLALIVTTLPFAALVALPIALGNLLIFRDPRLILFRQLRVGRRGRTFHIYKFRTMTEARRADFDSWSSGEDGLRVTRFGRLLRNAHLDELPQLLNILRGEMVFIGPRPEMVEIDAWARERVAGFHKRLALKPGITGRSQVTQGYAGRDPEAYAEKLRGDDHYRTHMSLAEDLKILARTAAWMLRGRGWRWKKQAKEAPRGETSGSQAA